MREASLLVVEQPDELIERIAVGDRAALEELYERNRRPLLGYLHVLTGDHGLAEEILQDALFAAWNGADRFTGSSSGRAWLYGIARRRARDAMRKRRFQFVDLASIDEVAASEPEPADIALVNAGIGDLADAIDRLSDAHRETLILTFVHGLSYQELADVVGVPIGTVKSRLSNAKRALRVVLNEAEEGRR
jgi:RNA polymerase sigma factor (sigma-70 family)